MRLGGGATTRSVVVAWSLVLAACASLPDGAFDRVVAGRTIEGRMAIRYKDLETSKEESLSGRFVWTAAADDVELGLLDPLGQTVALIRADGRRASITFRDGRRIVGATPEALTQQALGWTVPLRGLRAWLDGRTDGGVATTLDDGRIRQDGWTIRFVPADDAAPGGPPRRIDLAYPGPPAEIEMRLVVDRRSEP